METYRVEMFVLIPFNRTLEVEADSVLDAEKKALSLVLGEGYLSEKWEQDYDAELDFLVNDVEEA